MRCGYCGEDVNPDGTERGVITNARQAPKLHSCLEPLHKGALDIALLQVAKVLDQHKRSIDALVRAIDAINAKGGREG